MKKILIVLICLLLVCGCGAVKLNNGEKAIIEFKEGAISSQDLYKVLKSKFGGKVIADVIDSYLLNKKYESTDQEDLYVKQAIKTIKKDADKYGLTYKQFLSSSYDVNTEDELEDYLRLNYKRNLWVEEYAKKEVSDKQIDQYYKKYVTGDIEASQILITVDAASDASEADKTLAEDKALNIAKQVIEKLQNGEDFAALAKQYSKDDATKGNGGVLGSVNVGDVPKEVLDALKKLKNGDYTKEAVKSDEGFHILYRTGSADKRELDDNLKDKIREIIAEELQEEDNFSSKAILALREENEMEFVDLELKKLYENQ